MKKRIRQCIWMIFFICGLGATEVLHALGCAAHHTESHVESASEQPHHNEKSTEAEHSSCDCLYSSHHCGQLSVYLVRADHLLSDGGVIVVRGDVLQDILKAPPFLEGPYQPPKFQ